jgi:hypothetical protein
MTNKYHKLIGQAQKEPAAKAKTLTKGIAMALLNGATHGKGASAAGALNAAASYYSGGTDLPSRLMNYGKEEYKKEHKDFYGKYPQTNAIAEALGSMFGGAVTGGAATKGAMLAGKGALKGIDLIRMVLEGRKIKRAYNAVKANPFAGNADDVMATIRPRKMGAYTIKRGEIAGTPENPIYQGLALKKATGNYNNFGLTKFILKHEGKSSELTELSRMLRQYHPVEITKAKEVYRAPINNNIFRTIFGINKNGDKTMITHFKEDNILDKILSKRK